MENYFENLLQYVLQQRANGVPAEQIRHALLSSNWDENLVDQVFVTVQDLERSEELAPPEPVPAPMQPTGLAHAQQQPYQQYQQAPAQAYQQQYQQPYRQSPAQPYQQPVAEAKPPKYKVFRAIADVFVSIRNNPLAVIANIVFSILAIALSVLIVGVLASVILGAFNIFNTSSAQIIVLATAVFAVWVIVNGAGLGLTVATTSLALADGFHRRKGPVVGTFVQGLKSAIRVWLACILWNVVLFGPIFLLAVVMLVMVLGSRQGLGGVAMALALSTFLYIGSVIWLLIAFLRFGLVPWVALFEPNVPILKTLKRSNHLLQKGGQWFIFKGSLLVGLITIILGAINGNSSFEEFENSTSVFASISVSLLGLLVIGVQTMLYLNRKAVRG